MFEENRTNNSRNRNKYKNEIIDWIL